jgi:hypothetical protein
VATAPCSTIRIACETAARDADAWHPERGPNTWLPARGSRSPRRSRSDPPVIPTDRCYPFLLLAPSELWNCPRCDCRTEGPASGRVVLVASRPDCTKRFGTLAWSPACEERSAFIPKDFCYPIPLDKAGMRSGLSVARPPLYGLLGHCCSE